MELERAYGLLQKQAGGHLDPERTQLVRSTMKYLYLHFALDPNRSTGKQRDRFFYA